MPTNYSFQLPSGATSDKILTAQLESNHAYKQVLDTYTSKGFQFIKSRAKVFLCYNPDHIDSSTTPSMLVIVPSLVKVDFEKQASHTALSITYAKTSKGVSITVGEVNVNHKPYGITDFKFSVYDAKKKGLHQVAHFTQENLKEAASDKKLESKVTAAGAIATGSDIDHIVQTTLSELLNDEYTKSSPAAYKAAILKDSTSIVAISRALATSSRVGAVNPASFLEGACCSSSSSSNACSSTSCSWSFISDPVEIANARG